MNQQYDHIIIGGGPTGLTLALCLSKYKKKVALIEKNNILGGCHGVDRDNNNLFSEHGPRIYIDNYLMFKKILSEMNMDFHELFTPYQFGISNIGGKTTEHLSTKELFILTKALFNLNESYKKISVKNYVENYNFSNNAKDYLDRLCRLTDGGGIDKYTLYSFLQIINQNFFYKIYQPKDPTDTTLFKKWKDYLLNNGVDIYLNTKIIDVTNTNNTITSVVCLSNKTHFNIMGKNFIFAIPPYSLLQIIKKSPNQKFKNSFGKYQNFLKWAQITNYITYIPIVFHWKKKLNLKKIWGFPATSWGVGHIVLSDYMNFNNSKSQTVISTVISRHNKSDYTNKTPNQTQNQNDLIKEVFRQLKISFPNLPPPDFSILSQNYRHDNKWISKNTAFMTTKYGYINDKSMIFNNLYNCGVHNGNSDYSFTSMESSIINAIKLVHKLIPQSKKYYAIKSSITFLNMFNVFCVIILILILVFFFMKK
jgi:hypothetical protein